MLYFRGIVLWFKPIIDVGLWCNKTLREYHELLQKEDRFHNAFIGELMKKYGE